MVTVAEKQHSYWPFPAECLPKPWTPEQVKEYEEQQRATLPDAPM